MGKDFINKKRTRRHSLSSNGKIGCILMKLKPLFSITRIFNLITSPNIIHWAQMEEFQEQEEKWFFFFLERQNFLVIRVLNSWNVLPPKANYFTSLNGFKATHDYFTMNGQLDMKSVLTLIGSRISWL